MGWLENLDSSVSLNDGKVAQLIGNRQKRKTGATSQNFSRQLITDFSACSNYSIAHNVTNETSPCLSCF